MTGFVPRDCLSCVDALNETYQDMFGTTQSFSEAKWSSIYSGSNTFRSVGVSHQDAERMKKAVHKLQGQLFEGERTACHVGNDGLEDVKPAVFGKENVSRIIAENGEIRPNFVGRRVAFFVRPKDYERADYPDRSAKNEKVDTDKNSGGRPNTGRDAALIFCGMFPNGIDATETSWKGALRDVNRQLEVLGLKQVAMTAFKENVKNLRRPK